MEIDTKNVRYIEAIGRRKTAAARVRMTPSARQALSVNNLAVETYFKTAEQRRVAMDALNHVKGANKWEITARISGGGLSAQAEALRHGIARALVAHDGGLRKKLKKAGFLKRDPRAKERRKFGKKGKARKSPKWSKR